MPAGPSPTTFAEAIQWIGSRSGLYAMKMENGRVVVSVKVGALHAREAATSFEQGEMEAALIRAIHRILEDG